MNANPKPEFHPDADTLSAFSEQALPVEERARVVTHVADCARCRAVVYLAHAAAEAAAVPARKGTARAGWRLSAFARWRVGLIPATALAAVGAVVLWVHMHHPVAPHGEMAQMLAQQEASALAVPATAAADRGDSQMAKTTPTVAPPLSPRRKARQSAVAKRPDVHPAAAPTGGPEPAVVRATPESALTQTSLHGVAMMRLAGRTTLPSGLNSVSSAVLLNRLVAVDSAGSVFLSQDGGKHWESVHPQWTGKAIAVEAPPEGVYRVNASARVEASDPARLEAPRAVPGEKSQSGELAPSPRPLTPGTFATIPPMQFKLITDRHQSWVSSDGKIWRGQDPRPGPDTP